MAALEPHNRYSTLTGNVKPHVRPDQSRTKKQRIISESTGLIKLQMAQRKAESNAKANNDFAKLEADFSTPEKMSTDNTLRLSPHKSPISKSLVSPRQPSRAFAYERTVKGSENSDFNEQMMLKLAAKQREVLELKSNMEIMKKKLNAAQRELQEMTSDWSRSNISMVPPVSSSPNRSPVRSTINKPAFEPLKSKPSIQGLKGSFTAATSQASANFQTNNGLNNLKKKLSMPQLKSKQSLMRFQQQLNANTNSNQIQMNFQKFQKDTNVFLEKGLSFVNNLKNDLMKEEDEYDIANEFNVKIRMHDKEDEDGYDTDGSDYGCADASDYALAVK